MRVEICAAPVRHQKLAGLAARLRHAVRIGERDEEAERIARLRPDGCLPERRKGGNSSIRPSLGEAAHVFGAFRAVAAKPFDSLAKVQCIAAKAALDEDCRKMCGVGCVPGARRFKHHPCEPRRQGEVAQMPARLGDSALPVERFEFLEEDPRLLERRRGRRIEKGKARRIAHAPFGAVEEEGREIGGKDLGASEGFERSRRRLLPQAVADARLGPAGAAPALIGRSARHAHRFEPRQPDIGLVDRHARKARSRSPPERPRW